MRAIRVQRPALLTAEQLMEARRRSALQVVQVRHSPLPSERVAFPRAGSGQWA